MAGVDVRVTGLDHLVVMAPDPMVLVDWYVERLGLAPERVEEYRRGEVLFPSVRIDAGTVIDVLEGERTGENVNHICLVAEGVDLQEVAASDRFEALGRPAVLWGARGEGLALYVRDPVGNTVELRTYPA